MGRRMVTKPHFWWLLGLFQHRGGHSHYNCSHQHYHHHHHDHFHSLKTSVNVWLHMSIMIITIHLWVHVITLEASESLSLIFLTMHWDVLLVQCTSVLNVQCTRWLGHYCHCHHHYTHHHQQKLNCYDLHPHPQNYSAVCQSVDVLDDWVLPSVVNKGDKVSVFIIMIMKIIMILIVTLNHQCTC